MRKIKKEDGLLRTVLAFLINNPSLRLDISLLGGAIMNVLYITTNLLSVFFGGGTWPLTVTVYYSVLLIVRLYLFGYRELEGGGPEDIARLYHVCRRVGVFMLLLDFLASVMMVYTVTAGNIREFRGVFILGFALFTVYSLSSSVIGIVRLRRRNTPLALAARNLTLASALFSVFNLVFSLLTTLGADTAVIRKANAAVGTSSFFIIISLAVYLIVKSTAEIRGIPK